MKALLYGEGGNLDHLFDSKSKINQIIAENYVRSEKLMFDMDDENFRPPSPIRAVRRNPQLHFASDSTVESNLDSGSTVATQELKELIEKRNEILKLSENMVKTKKDEKAKATERIKISMLNSIIFSFSSKFY